MRSTAPNIRQYINGKIFYAVLLTFAMPFIGCSQNVPAQTTEKTNDIVAIQPSKDDKVYKGDVKLHTQQEIEDFGKQQYTFIAGNLELEPVTSDYSDEVLDTKPLETIKTIDGNLLVTRFIKLLSVAGLRHLEQVNGDFVISGCGLKRIDSINQLTLIKGELVFGNNTADYGKGGLAEIAGFEKLITVKNIYISGNSALTKLDAFNKVETIHQLQIIDSKIAVLNSFKVLKTVKLNFTVEHDPALTAITLEQLETVEGMFALHGNSQLNGNIHLPKLQKIKELFIRSNEQFDNYCDFADLIRQGKVGSLDAEGNKVDLTAKEIVKKCK